MLVRHHRKKLQIQLHSLNTLIHIWGEYARSFKNINKYLLQKNDTQMLYIIIYTLTILSERATFGNIISPGEKKITVCDWKLIMNWIAHKEDNHEQLQELTVLWQWMEPYIFNLLTSCASHISLLLGRQHRQWWIAPDTDRDRMSINKRPYDE